MRHLNLCNLRPIHIIAELLSLQATGDNCITPALSVGVSFNNSSSHTRVWMTQWTVCSLLCCINRFCMRSLFWTSCSTLVRLIVIIIVISRRTSTVGLGFPINLQLLYLQVARIHRKPASLSRRSRYLVVGCL